MGRPPLPQDQKRQQVNIRLSPADRARLEEIADRRGTALAATAGAALAQMIDWDRAAGEGGMTLKRLDAFTRIGRMDDETIELLDDICAEIKLIQEMTRKRWHKNRRTWAAVAQMLARGPILWRRVDDPMNDDELRQASLDGWAISELKSKKVEAIARLGVVVSARANTSGAVNALLGLGAYDTTSNREGEQAIIDALPDTHGREVAQQLFAELLDLDVKEEENNRAFADLHRPFVEEELAGRDLYKEHRKGVAASAKEAGEPYFYEDLR